MPPKARKWLMVDAAWAFPGRRPGVDLVFADIAFVEKIARDLVGICITHAHEDHIGGSRPYGRGSNAEFATPLRRASLKCGG
jgi:ribonuclease J